MTLFPIKIPGQASAVSAGLAVLIAFICSGLSAFAHDGKVHDYASNPHYLRGQSAKMIMQNPAHEIVGSEYNFTTKSWQILIQTEQGTLWSCSAMMTYIATGWRCEGGYDNQHVPFEN